MKSKGVCRSVGSGKVYKYSSVMKEAETVPKSFILPYLPPILDQESVQSCVAHSLAEAFQAQDKDKTDISVLGIYGLWRNHEGEGMYPETAFDLGRSLGTPSRAVAPENIEVPEAIKKAKEYRAKYPSEFIYRVGSFYKIDREDKVPSARLIKNALLQFNCPLLVLTENGTHCEILIGWADKGEKSPIDGETEREDVFYIQNSWGNIPFPRRREKITKIEEAYIVLMEEAKMPFADTKGHWAEKYIKQAYFAGYLNGKTEDKFCPEDYIKRGEAAKLISTLLTSYDEKILKLEERIRELEEK